ncbi:MAG: oligosaccharide flippase family protein [Bacteroidota bacterium]
MKKLLGHISIVVLLNLLVKPLWLLVEMEVQDQVGHAEWGLYAALLSFGFLFITLSDLGINQYATKMLAGDPGLMRSYFPNLLSFKFFLTLLYPVIMGVVAWLLGYPEQHIYFLVLLCLVHSGGQLMNFFRANFQAMQRFSLDGFLSVFDRIILLLLTIYLFYTQLDISRFIYARVVTVILSVIVFYGLIIRMYGWFKPKLDIPLVRNIITYSLSLALMTVLYSIHDKVDQVMLERLAGEKENGLYAGAYRWLEAFSMYMWTVLPIFFARFAFYVKDLKEQEKLLHKGQIITSLPLTLVSIFVWFYGEKLLFLFDQSSPEEIAVMTQCLQAVFVALWLNGNFAIFSTLLTATGHENAVNVFAGISIVVNIGLNWYFIPIHGAIASAWTTVISYLILSICYIFYFQLRLSIKVPYTQIVKLFILTGAVWLLFYLLDMQGWDWRIVTGVGVLAIGGMSFGLRLFSVQMVRELLSRGK